MLKFSIVIICRNQMELIPRCLASVLGQTYKNTEIIWVDDASTDDSVGVIGKFGEGRVTLMRNDQCLGALASRMIGLGAATGDYILFVDGDDELETSCCETMARVLEKREYDVVGFGADVAFDRPCTESEISGIHKWLTPYEGEILGPDIMKACFIEHKISHTIWNKCYSHALMRRASEHITREYISTGTDIAFSFVVLHLAQTFFGIEDKLYVYYYGLGISTAPTLSADKIIRNLSAHTVCERCREYASASGLGQEYFGVLSYFESNFIHDAFNKLRLLQPDEQTRTAKALFDTYGAKKVADILAEAYWYNSAFAAEAINVPEIFPVKRKKILTVGMFYIKLYNGGIQRVMSLLSHIFADAGYRVVIITEEEPNENDYPLPTGTLREVIGRAPSNGAEIQMRSARWMNIIDKYDIDAVVYHHWTSPGLFWDLCAIKSRGAAFICHTHNMFTAGLVDGWPGILNTKKAVSRSDAVIVLSRVDSIHWETSNSNVRTVPNPITLLPDEVEPSALAGHDILWLGRMDDSQKNPVDALIIIKKVLSYVPDATLTMVGAASEGTKAILQKKIDELGIGGHVAMPGFSLDVARYFQNSSLFLVTSSYEGWCMTIGESLAVGVPIVCYELPYMRMTEKSKAIISVPWKNYDAAAAAVGSLLLNSGELHAMGAAARHEASEYAAFDYCALWSGIFDEVTETKIRNNEPITGEVFQKYDATVELAFRQMCATIERLRIEKDEIGRSARQELSDCMAAKTAAVAQAEALAAAERSQIYNSRRYKIGKVVLAVPTAIISFIKKLFRRG